MGEKQRYGYLDLLKVIAMLCVCLYHFPMIAPTAYVRPFPVQTLLSRYLRLFDVMGVPLFMMVNGALLLNRPFRLKRHALRCAMLMGGVYVWYILTMVCGHAWQSGPGFVVQNWRGILYSAQYLTEYGGIGTSHLWFIPMLAALYLLVPLIRAAMDSADEQIRRGLLFCLGGLGLFAFALRDIGHVRAAVPVLRSLDLSGLEAFNPFRGHYGAMLVYFVLGGLLHRAYERMLRVPPALCAGLVLGGSLALFAEWYLVTIRTEAMYDIVFGGYSCLPTLMMTLGVFMGAARLDAKRGISRGRLGGAISLVGRNTLAIYYLHWIVGLTVLRLVRMPGCLAVNWAKAVAMMLAGALLGEGLRRVPLLRRLV